LELFKSILADQKSLPREQPYKDLVNLINFILRKFFKALSEDPFLAVEVGIDYLSIKFNMIVETPFVQAFFPKNRGQWKQFSSWQPDEGMKMHSQNSMKDLQIRKGYSWSDQVGIAIALLVENGKSRLVEWTKDVSFQMLMRTRV
jgi:replication fork protection complex subunit Tof1/Swi1